LAFSIKINFAAASQVGVSCKFKSGSLCGLIFVSLFGQRVESKNAIQAFTLKLFCYSLETTEKYISQNE